jgi:branched-subunit amino acid aminotransferase/4-amino-4-deoxychorismate lyase
MHLWLRQDNLFSYTEMCFVCGEPFELRMFVVEVRDGAEMMGFVCYDCLELDQSAQADRLDAHAARLRQHATWLEEIAADGFPQLRQAEAQTYAAWQDERNLPRVTDVDLPF